MLLQRHLLVLGNSVAGSLTQPPTDKKCPFTGLVSIRGRILTGTVVSTKMHRTLIIRREYLHFIPKYSRYEKRHKNLAAHVSPAFRVEDGDQVTVGQCRPLSKTVRFLPKTWFGGVARGKLTLLSGPLQRSPCAPKNRKGGQAVQQVLDTEFKLWDSHSWHAWLARSALRQKEDFVM